MKRRIRILFLISFSLLGFGCSQKDIEQTPNKMKPDSTQGSENESSKKEEEHLEISYENQLTFIIKNLTDKKVAIDISEIDIFQLMNDEWQSIESVRTSLFMTEFIEPGMSTDYTSLEDLKEEVEYKLTIPFSLDVNENKKLKQTYFFTVN